MKEKIKSKQKSREKRIVFLGSQLFKSFLTLVFSLALLLVSLFSWMATVEPSLAFDVGTITGISGFNIRFLVNGEYADNKLVMIESLIPGSTSTISFEITNASAENSSSFRVSLSGAEGKVVEFNEELGDYEYVVDSVMLDIFSIINLENAESQTLAEIVDSGGLIADFDIDLEQGEKLQLDFSIHMSVNIQNPNRYQNAILSLKNLSIALFGQ